MASKKLPNSGHVVYDSGNDTATGKKRAVLPGGGVSVAERARLFGAQITHSSPAKPYHSANHLSQKPPLNNQPPKSNVIQQERDYQPPRPDTDRHPKQNTSYSSPHRTPNTYRSATEINERSKREPIAPIDPRNYSKAARSSNHNSHVPTRQQPINSYDSFQRLSPQRHMSNKSKSTQILPGKLSSSEDEDTYSALYDKSKSSYKTAYQSSNYFRPIQDPLDVLFKDVPKEYIQQEIPRKTIDTNATDLQAFDLGSLINRIQQDYADNARPYVSSVQFVQHDQSLANIGFITPATNRKDYTRRTGDMYSRQVPSSHHYDIIDTNGFYPYENMQSRQPYSSNNYSSMKRHRHHKRYHNQASSPIHILETSNKVNSRQQPESVPIAPVPKVPTPVVVSSSDEEDEEEATKPAESETSSEEESEDESEAAPPLPPPLQTVNGTARASIPSGTPIIQPNGVGRPALGNQTTPAMARPPAQPSESEESESKESGSESESESDDDDAKKPKPKSLPPVRPNNQRTTPGTPQTTARVVPPRGSNDHNSTNQPPESSSSVKSFDLTDSGKSSSFGGKLKSFTNKFRRNKS